jgi:hypothetical protein
VEGNVRSLCAPRAPCLEFNKLFFGPLEIIAEQCGFKEKLRRVTTETPFFEFVQQGGQCQHQWFPACIAEAPCPGNGGNSSNSCALPAAAP